MALLFAILLSLPRALPQTTTTSLISPSPSSSATLPSGPSTITTFVGGAPDFGAQRHIPVLRQPLFVAPDLAGGFYVSQQGRDCVRIYYGNGSTGNLAGSCNLAASLQVGEPLGDGMVALNRPTGRSPRLQGRALLANFSGVFIADALFARVRFVDTVGSGVISTVIGNGALCPGAGADAAGPASAMCLGSLPGGLAWNFSCSSAAAAAGPPAACALRTPPSAAAAQLLLSDAASGLIRAFSPATGLLTTVAGVAGVLPTAGASGNGAPWRAAPMAPTALAVHPFTGVVHFLDGALGTARALADNGTVAHVAGRPFQASLGFPDCTGTFAASTRLETAVALAFDSNGLLLVAEGGTWGAVTRIDAAGRRVCLVQGAYYASLQEFVGGGVGWAWAPPA